MDDLHLRHYWSWQSASGAAPAAMDAERRAMLTDVIPCHGNPVEYMQKIT